MAQIRCRFLPTRMNPLDTVEQNDLAIWEFWFLPFPYLVDHRDQRTEEGEHVPDHDDLRQ